MAAAPGSLSTLPRRSACSPGSGLRLCSADCVRLEGGEVTLARSREDLPLDAATQKFWCFRFRTNDAPLDVLPPFWNGSDGVFALRARACFLLGLGPEPDDTHSCELSQWARVP